MVDIRSAQMVAALVVVSCAVGCRQTADDLVAAIEKGDAAEIRALVGRLDDLDAAVHFVKEVTGLDGSHSNQEYVAPALHFAVDRGRLEAATLLLEAGASVNAAADPNGASPLIWAALGNDTEIATLLIEHGADVQARSNVRRFVISRRLQSQLKYGERGRNYGSDAQETDVDGSTPLLFSARHGDIESACLLLAAGANSNDTARDGSSERVVSV